MLLCVDASWVDETKNAGICWILYDRQGMSILKGSASIMATDSALEAEAIALREALLQMKKLGYENITFCGDSEQLYRALKHSSKHILQHPVAIQGHLEDILALSKNSYCFKNIRRGANVHADKLAKQARVNHSPYVISFVL